MIIFTVDGPAGSGKGYVTKLLAEEFKLNRIELGLFFRAIASIVLESGMRVNEFEAVERFTLSNLKRRDLYSSDVTRLTSRFSKIPEVREALVPLMRQLATVPPGCVVDGRSGLYLFPAPKVARINFFLTAKEEKRVTRRLGQQAGFTETEVRKALRARDNDDRLREDHPLLTDEEAKARHNGATFFFIDSTNMDVKEVHFKFQSVCRANLGIWRGLEENPNYRGPRSSVL